jgi:hypothetical protein
MPVFSLRLSALVVLVALVALTSCSTTPVATATVAKTPEFYWSAARETYTAGDYIKTADHLDHLIDNQNEYTARAIPWSLVLTSGMAAGYMELADAYKAGARLNKPKALDFHRKAMDYRTMASPLALRFAQNVEKLEQLSGSITLAFPLPNGNAAEPALMKQIARGTEISAGDAVTVQWLAIQRNVLLTTCLAAGSPNDAARTLEILGHASSITPRATFNKAIAAMLDREAGLYSRNNLDEPTKMAALHERARVVLGNAGPASRTALAKMDLRH